MLGSTQSSDSDFKFCYTCGTYVSRGFVIKLDYEGKIIWSRIPIGDDSKKDIISNGWYAGVEVNDGIVAVGYSNSGPNNIQDNNYHIVKMNKFTGEIIWRRNIGDFVF
ncbi:MAG: hypothetical protein IPO85_18150 [Saprospiraceae bacterium]|uniref:PQQ-like beta-propeller repeat protein n=1 Tax=Candidatus Defluviibacterium haderslevense TaxID=2981993 RepID=A0A9D7XFX6_9BACT|nr:hypothetical protein [Candidatus Defluviibacterium haderslevense]